MESLLLAGTPAARAIVAGILTTALLFYIRPEPVFRADGTPRIARFIARPDQLAQSTAYPWWLIVLAVVVAVDLFV